MKVVLALALLLAGCGGGSAQQSTDTTMPYAQFKTHVESANLPADTAYELGWLAGVKAQPCYEQAYDAYREAVKSMDLNGTTFDLTQVLSLSKC